MNERQYREVCEACDRVLLAADPTIERVAIAWLHVLNEHPSNLAKYSDLFGSKRTDSLIGVKSALLQARQWFKSRQRPYSKAWLPDRADVIFVSHLLNEAQAGAAEDFYFGCLPETLTGNGLSSIVVLRDHTGLSPQDLSSRWPPNMAPRLLLSDTLSWREELALRKRLHQEAIRLRAEAKQSETTLHQRVLDCAAKQAVSISSIATLRFYHQIMSLVERLRPRSIVVTYEGHAWERLAFAAARRVVPGVRCIGYHHTILRPLRHALQRSLGEVYDPDTILTAGTITRNMIMSKLNMPKTKVNVLGTHRKTSDITPQAVTKLPNCLIIPVGMVDEYVLLMDFALDCASLVPEVRFVLRLHPIMSFEKLAIRDVRLKKLPPNFELSEKPISDDFARSRWALYRSSSAAVHAVLAGVRPVYLSQESEMTVDPLHELTTWRCNVKQPEDFLSVVNSDLQTSTTDQAKELMSAHAYCEQYFTHMNSAELERIICE